ncbi:MAG: DUF1565 domain-containing protein, partial [Caldilineaceae bacterium]|nr:DUF1565 domain-containing protein [Caldilineaceae bacterium]
MMSFSTMPPRPLFAALTVALLLAMSSLRWDATAPWHVAAAQTPAGAQFFVAPIGSDRNPGTEELPFRTIQYAVDHAGAGDTVIVRAGVYHEAVTVTTSGTAEAPLIITAYPGEQRVIDVRYRLPE